MSVILLQWPMNLCGIISLHKLEELKLLECHTWLFSKDQQPGVWELQCEGEQSCPLLCQVCHHVLLTLIEVRFLTHHRVV